MYYSNTQEDELGFDAFIAPDGFDRTAQPVDIYEKFKYWYPIDSKAKYIYYYSDGNYPLTLTPTTDEYYKYGYTRWNAATSQYIDVTEDMPLNSAARTIWGTTATFGDESGYTKRWVIVYRVSSEKFDVTVQANKAIWIYLSTIATSIYCSGANSFVKYIHFANLNSMTSTPTYPAFKSVPNIQGRLTVPETSRNGLAMEMLYWNPLVKWVDLPKTISVPIYHSGYSSLNVGAIIEFNFGATTNLGANDSERNGYSNLSRISVSAQNTLYTSFDYCDIIYTKDKTVLYWLAPKTVRGLTIPDQLPQSQIGVDSTTGIGTKLSTNIMQGYQLYLGTQITDLTNLYLSNKSFSTIEVGVGNTAFMAENNILYNSTKTELIKTGTNNTGSLVIDNAVTTIKANAFLRCVGYTGGLTIPTTVTTIESGSISGLKNLTGDLIFTGGQWNLSTYNYFDFANFTATSIKSIIDNDQLVNGTVGSPKNFYISKTTYDALVALSGGQASIDLAASRYINFTAFLKGNKLSLDASNPLSYPGSGTLWTDLSGSGNNGTLVNGVSFSTANGGVMSFDGVNDYVSSPLDKSELGSEFTISMISKMNSTQSGVGLWQIAGELNATLPWILCQRQTGGINFLVNGNYRGLISIPNDTYFYLTLTYSNNVWLIYVNNILRQTINQSIGGSSGSLLFLGNGYNGYTNAIFDNIDVFNYINTEQVTPTFKH